MPFAFLGIVFLLRTLAAHGSEVEIGSSEYCLEAVHRVEPADNGVDVVGINLDCVATPSGFFGCDQGGAAAGKSVENDSIALGAIEDRVGYQGYRLDGRVHSKFGTPIASKGV